MRAKVDLPLMKLEVANRRKRGKGVYLNDGEKKRLLDELNDFLEGKVEVKRIRNGEHQTIETLINEEALLFAKYLRNENKIWSPRIGCLKTFEKELSY